MKLICQGNELSDALSKVVKALPIKRNNPILDGVKLTALGDTLTIFATDLELAIEKKINAQVLIEGEIVVPGKLFADYAKKIEEEQVELDGTDSSKLVIKYLDSELQIKCMSADEYPVFKEVDTQNSFIILKKNSKRSFPRSFSTLRLTKQDLPFAAYASTLKTKKSKRSLQTATDLRLQKHKSKTTA